MSGSPDDAHAEMRVCAICRALIAGLIGGAAIGLIDTLLAWRANAQFLGFGGRLRLAIFAASLYGTAGALIGAGVVAFLIALRRFTVAGPLYRHATAQHELVRESDPRDALAGVLLVIAGLPILGGALAGAYRVGMQIITHRKHQGLIIAVTIAATLIALKLAALATLFVARPIELGLRRTGRRAVRVLSCSPRPSRSAWASCWSAGSWAMSSRASRSRSTICTCGRSSSPSRWPARA